MSTLRAAVKRWHDRLGPGLFGLACSGGADSMALADAAIAVHGAANVVVIHIDHGLSPRSAEVGEAVAAWARGQGAAVLVRRIEVKRRASLEAAARDARYAALDAIRIEIGASHILLGHTARDQAETILMRIVRGTGPAGLAGIPAMRGPFVRPLLELPRELVDAYVAARALPTHDDPMNADPRIARVRFREQILPALRAENPALDDALTRLASTAREWTAALDVLAEPLAAPTRAGAPMSCTMLASHEPAVRKRAYTIALDRAGLGYDAVHLDAIDALVMQQAGGEHAIDVPGGRIVRSYERLLVTPTAAATGHPGHTEPTGRRGAPPASEPTEHRRVPTVSGAAASGAAVSGAAVSGAAVSGQAMSGPAPGYELRVWRPGDRMKPARLKGRSRKLSDLFIDAKVPREQRRTARVLVRSRDHAIVWAEHVGIAFGESEAGLPLPDRIAGDF